MLLCVSDCWINDEWHCPNSSGTSSHIFSCLHHSMRSWHHTTSITRFPRNSGDPMRARSGQGKHIVSMEPCHKSKPCYYEKIWINSTFLKWSLKYYLLAEGHQLSSERTAALRRDPGGLSRPPRKFNQSYRLIIQGFSDDSRNAVTRVIYHGCLMQHLEALWYTESWLIVSLERRFDGGLWGKMVCLTTCWKLHSQTGWFIAERKTVFVTVSCFSFHLTSSNTFLVSVCVCVFM